VSLEYVKPVQLNFPRAAELGRGVIEQILAKRPPPASLFNINIPSLERGQPQGVKVVPQGLLRYRERYDRRKDPRGRIYFWITPELACPPHEEDTDVCSMAAQYITVTPLKFDLTQPALLEQMRKWQWRV
jgi:5'/3'-nucleotidase